MPEPLTKSRTTFFASPADMGRRRSSMMCCRLGCESNLTWSDSGVSSTMRCVILASAPDKSAPPASPAKSMWSRESRSMPLGSAAYTALGITALSKRFFVPVKVKLMAAFEMTAWPKPWLISPAASLSYLPDPEYVWVACTWSAPPLTTESRKPTAAPATVPSWDAAPGFLFLMSKAT